MEDKLVTTINGEVIESSKCRYIEKEYYKVGDVTIKDSGDCYLIDGRYVRYNTGYIEYDHEKGTYLRTNSNPMIYGIVNFKNDKPEFGHFTENKIKNVIVVLENGDQYVCMDENLLINNLNYREHLASGIYFHITLKRAYEFSRLEVVDRRYKENLPYDSREILDDYIQKYENNYNPTINETVKKYAKVLDGLSFGLEFETTIGKIPKNKLEVLPLIPLRDGSISGLEYVTIPLSGEKGLQAVIDCVKELDKRTEYDNTCALHLHIGGLPRTKESILSFFKVCTHIQEEMFGMFPLYKKYNFGVKRKNYSKPFPLNKLNTQMDSCINNKNIDENFDVLYRYLSVGQSFYDVNCNLNNVINHPSDPRGTSKWQITTRYYSQNLIPILFGNKKTIEFRIHTPTYDINKIISFIFINAILIKFSMKYQKEILQERYFLSNRDLMSIIRGYLAKVKEYNDINDILSDYLCEYISIRTEETYRQCCDQNIVGNEDLICTPNYIDWLDTKINNEQVDDLIYLFRNNRPGFPVIDRLHADPDNPIKLYQLGSGINREIKINRHRTVDEIRSDNFLLKQREHGKVIQLSNGTNYRFSQITGYWEKALAPINPNIQQEIGRWRRMMEDFGAVAINNGENEQLIPELPDDEENNEVDNPQNEW